jgi:hypothetical protein
MDMSRSGWTRVDKWTSALLCELVEGPLLGAVIDEGTRLDEVI